MIDARAAAAAAQDQQTQSQVVGAAFSTAFRDVSHVNERRHFIKPRTHRLKVRTPLGSALNILTTDRRRLLRPEDCNMIQTTVTIILNGCGLRSCRQTVTCQMMFEVVSTERKTPL